MNKYEAALFNALSYKYPGYSIEFDEFPEIMIIWIKNRSSKSIYRKAISKPIDISFVENVIERMINEMRENEIWAESRRLEKVYCENDVKSLTKCYYGMWPGNKYTIAPKEVIFQDEKTTIINWTDGTKTIVKCSEDDTFSPEAGVALCYMKKFITDNDSERFHRLLKSLISVSKFKNSKQEDKISLFDCAEIIAGTISKLQTLYTEVKNDHDTGASDNTSNNDSDGPSMEVE